MALCGMSSSLIISTFTVFVSLAFIGKSSVDAGATLELQMLTFANPSKERYDGRCCDTFCGSCDTIFKFSLDRSDSDNNPRGSHYWTKTTGTFSHQNSVTFGSDMKGISNPIRKTFSSWPTSGVKLKVWVTDDDNIWSRDDDIDGFVKLIKMTPARRSWLASWQFGTIYGIRPEKKTKLTFTYKLYCDANYYASDCSVHCVPSDTDTDGHYTCHPTTGQIICRPGWEDVSNKCKTWSDDCIGHRCRNGAACVDGLRSYTCSCPTGYTGHYCDVNVHEMCESYPGQDDSSCSARRAEKILTSLNQLVQSCNDTDYVITQKLAAAASNLASAVSHLHARTDCPVGFTYVASVNGCYKEVTLAMNWTDAGQYCRSLDGHLLVISHQQEQAAVAEMLGAKQSQCYGFYWTAGYRANENSDWVWRVATTSSHYHESPMIYKNWWSAQRGEGSCMSLYTDYKWVDESCANTGCSVCEVDIHV